MLWLVIDGGGGFPAGRAGIGCGAILSSIREVREVPRPWNLLEGHQLLRCLHGINSRHWQRLKRGRGIWGGARRLRASKRQKERAWERETTCSGVRCRRRRTLANLLIGIVLQISSSTLPTLFWHSPFFLGFQLVVTLEQKIIPSFKFDLNCTYNLRLNNKSIVFNEKQPRIVVIWALKILPQPDSSREPLLAP